MDIHEFSQILIKAISNGATHIRIDSETNQLIFTDEKDVDTIQF